MKIRYKKHGEVVHRKDQQDDDYKGNKKIKNMDKVRKTFDKWGQNGRAELMEIEHSTNVLKFLKSISFDKPFTFLDIGCGNGWTIRKIATEKNCKRAIGIDKSKKMIIQSEKKIENKKEKFMHTDIESMKYKEKFDFIFSMESLYYADSIEIALEKIYKLLTPGGQFFAVLIFTQITRQLQDGQEL